MEVEADELIRHRQRIATSFTSARKSATSTPTNYCYGDIPHVSKRRVHFAGEEGSSEGNDSLTVNCYQKTSQNAFRQDSQELCLLRECNHQIDRELLC